MSTPIPPAPNTSADDLMAQLIRQVANLATAMEERSSSKSSMNKPKVFKGKDGAEARRFMAQFQNWASEQPDLAKSQVKLIKSALGFFTESAGDWATPHLLHFNAENPPFGGNWEAFLKEFSQRFEPMDPGMEARSEIKNLRQSKGQTVAEFAQKFKDIGDRTEMSDIDLRERFFTALLPEIRQHLITVNIAQGIAPTLKEAIKRAISVDVYLHDPTMTGRNSGYPPTHTAHTTPADPHAMDIDATHTSNGNTREAFLARMRGRCFGCGAQGHVKQNCPHRETTCRYCGRRGHLEAVCQDKFMGLGRDRGRRQQPRRQQISATGPAPFSLFPNESVQIASSTPTSAPAPVAATPSPPNQDFSNQIGQIRELLDRANAMSSSSSGFQQGF